MTSASFARIVSVCRHLGVPQRLKSEAEVRDHLAALLRASGIEVAREVTIERGKRLDIAAFGEDGRYVAIEVKRRRPAPSVFGQLRKYAATGKVAGIILFCERAITIDGDVGVPCEVIGFGRAFGVSL